MNKKISFCENTNIVKQVGALLKEVLYVLHVIISRHTAEGSVITTISQMGKAKC